MLHNLNIIGGGKLGCMIAKMLASMVNDITITIITRRKAIISEIFFDSEKIRVIDYTDEVKKNIPCIITVSCNEASILHELAKNNKSINRFSVASHNTDVIVSVIPYLVSLRSSAYFVLTNPVEWIMEHLISTSQLGKKNIYGLGLDLDSRRMEMAIEMITGIKVENLISVGSHMQPIPLIETGIISDDICITPSMARKNLQRYGEYPYNISNMNLALEFDILLEQVLQGEHNLINKERLELLLQGMTELLIKSEFSSGKPPVDHPAYSVANTIYSYFQGKRVNVSYVKNKYVVGGLVLINTESGKYREIPITNTALFTE